MFNWLKAGVTIAFWYTSNIVVVISNKYLLTNYGFKYPIFLTGCHMLACATLAYITSLTGLVPKQGINNFTQFWKIALLGCTFCLSVVLGNISLRYIPVSFSQTIGATTPLFTAVIAFILLCQTESVRVYLSLIPVALGLILASQGEPLFNMIGFAFAITSTCARGFKSVLSGMLLTDSTEKMNSMNLLLYMSPIAATALLPAVLISERDVLYAVKEHAAANAWFLPALAINAAISFLVNLSNFMVTKQTSALTLQVLGNAKGVLAAGVSILLFKNPITMRGATGYAIALGGVALYSWAKSAAAKAKALAEQAAQQEESMVLIEEGASPKIKSYPTPHRASKSLPLLDKSSLTPTTNVIAHAGMWPAPPGMKANLLEV